MKPELPGIDRDKMVSPHAQEVEFALILSRMINTVKEDPSQMRLAIYEFARARLKLDAAWAEEPEQQRLSAALETAIQGVEQFSTRHDEKERLQPPTPSAQIAAGALPAEPPSTSMVPIHPLNSCARRHSFASRSLFAGRSGAGCGKANAGAGHRRRPGYRSESCCSPWWRAWQFISNGCRPRRRPRIYPHR